MPELPEVEILVRQLRAQLAGRSITRVEVRDRKLKLPASLAGRRIVAVTRRAKYILMAFDDGRYLLVHLRMTGWFEFQPPKRYRLAIQAGAVTAYFEDTRRFGEARVISADELMRITGKLGVEPLARGFRLKPFTTARAIKVALLDQSLIAGVGNIYASEALWRARLDPRRSAKRLDAGALRRLERAIVASFLKAVAYGPRIFEVQRFAVYDRAGKPCRRCSMTIRRIVQAQRSTYFCPRCQSRGR